MKTTHVGRRAGAIRRWIIIKPNAREERVETLPDGSLRASVKAPPREGKANEALVRLIARHFKVPPSSVRIASGAGGRRKLIEIG